MLLVAFTVRSHTVASPSQSSTSGSALIDAVQDEAVVQFVIVDEMLVAVIVHVAPLVQGSIAESRKISDVHSVLSPVQPDISMLAAASFVQVVAPPMPVPIQPSVPESM
jgi:hypothetical protein